MPNQVFKDVTTIQRLAINVSKLGNGDNIAVFGIGAAFTNSWTCSGTFQGNPFTLLEDPTNVGWSNIGSMRLDTFAQENSPTLTSNTSRGWKASCQGLQQVAFNITAVTGDMPTSIVTAYDPAGTGIVQAVGSSQSISGTLTVTSSSASALAVGPNGATNPVLDVNGSTSSQADGLSIIGLAAGSGVNLLGITSGTNAPVNISAAGSGNVVMNSTGTGLVSFTNGMSIADGKNIALATTTGTNIGTATTQKLGFYGVTPAVQPIASTDKTTGTSGSSTGVSLDTTFKGNGGTAAYTVGGVVTSLKALGLLAS